VIRSGMFRLTLLSLTCFVLAAQIVPQRASAQKGFESIFNGKDLTGWVGDSDLWSVQDGAITGITKGKDHLSHNKFIIWEGGKPGDFELRLKFRLEGDSNSGVQYRSTRLKDVGEWVVGGYQVDIHPKAEYLGMLYDERGRGIVAQNGQKTIITPKGEKKTTSLEIDVKPVDLTEWHELALIVRGNRFTHKIDGKVVAQITDNQKEEREMEGVIAFQVHRGPAMKVQFKDIKIKKIDFAKMQARRKANVAKKAAEAKDDAAKEAPKAANKK